MQTHQAGVELRAERALHLLPRPLRQAERLLDQPFLCVDGDGGGECGGIRPQGFHHFLEEGTREGGVEGADQSSEFSVAGEGPVPPHLPKVEAEPEGVGRAGPELRAQKGAEEGGAGPERGPAGDGGGPEEPVEVEGDERVRHRRDERRRLGGGETNGVALQGLQCAGELPPAGGEELQQAAGRLPALPRRANREGAEREFQTEERESGSRISGELRSAPAEQAAEKPGHPPPPPPPSSPFHLSLSRVRSNFRGRVHVACQRKHPVEMPLGQLGQKLPEERRPAQKCTENRAATKEMGLYGPIYSGMAPAAAAED